jgi:putative solute:sodium symporter small subunit
MLRTARTPRAVFWTRTKALTLVLLLLWLAVNLAVPWFARDLSSSQLLGFPAGYWLAAEGALAVYLLIIVAYVLAMDRLEGDCIADQRSETPDAHGKPDSP